jgi:preprotein translocase subunit SecE
VSNDHDGVSEDGHEPVDAVPSDEAAQESLPDGGSTAKSSHAEGSDEAGDKSRTAPAAEAADDQTASDGAVGGDTAALSTTTPVSAGSARAAARRSAARAGISESKGAATPKRAAATTVKKPNMFSRLGRFLREVVAELRKVIWPTKNQMVTYTIVVIAFVAFMVALVGVLDLLFAKGVLAVFG